MQFVLHTRNKSLPDIRVNRVVPPALPTPGHDAVPTLEGTHKQVEQNGHQSSGHTKGKEIVGTAESRDHQTVDLAPSHGRTKGARGTHKGQTQGGTKGD